MSYGASTEVELREVDALTPGSPPVASRAASAPAKPVLRSMPRPNVEVGVLTAMVIAICMGLVGLVGLVGAVRNASLRSIAADERAIEERAIEQRVDLAKAASDARDAGRRLDDIRRRMDEIQREMDALRQRGSRP